MSRVPGTTIPVGRTGFPISIRDRRLDVEADHTPTAVTMLSDSAVNVASVPQRSPLRYPGGKTWLVPVIRRWLAGIDPRPDVFIEPFSGGATASLTAVMEGLVDRAVLCEKDPDIANLLSCIVNEPERLAHKIETFEVTTDSLRNVADEVPDTELERAFKTLIRNRISRGGILAKGASIMKEGENGKGVASRWYAQTLARRVRAIGNYADRLHVFHGDGLTLVELAKDNSSAAFFVDPPYTAAGKGSGRRLYTYNEVDHEDLFERMSVVQGSFMMTYDESTEIIEMAYRHGFNIGKIAMKNTHHNLLYELLITSSEIPA